MVQLLDRHDRDCAALAARLGVPHVVVPDELPGSPFTFVPVMRRRRWRESGLWWPARRTLVLADALATNRFYTAGKAPIGVHLFLRLTPPRALTAYEPERILVGHGEGVHGPEASTAPGTRSTRVGADSRCSPVAARRQVVVRPKAARRSGWPDETRRRRGRRPSMAG